MTTPWYDLDDFDDLDGDQPAPAEILLEDIDYNSERLPGPARRAMVLLLTNRFITRSRYPGVWDTLMRHRQQIADRLADLFLELEIDEDYGVAFKRQSREDGAPIVLKRSRPLSRDASMLLIYLRREHDYTDARDEPLVVSRTQIAEFLRPFSTDASGHEARFERHVDAAITAVTGLNLLEADPDVDYLFTVSPAVVPLIGSDELIRFEELFRDAAQSGTRGEAATDAPDDEEWSQ